MRVAVHKQHLALERFGFLDQTVHELAVATHTRCCTFINGFRLGQIKSRIGLYHQHQTRRVLRPRLRERCRQPRDVGGIPLQVFGVGRITLHSLAGAFVRAVFGIQHEVVIAARHVDAHKDYPALAETGVFYVLLASLALVFKWHLGLTQAVHRGVHNLT